MDSFIIKDIDELFWFVREGNGRSSKVEKKSAGPRYLSSFPDEVHRLHEELRERDRQREESRRGQSPGAERRMEQWRREVGRELNSLRGHITRATSLGNLEERCIRGGAGGGDWRLK